MRRIGTGAVVMTLLLALGASLPSEAGPARPNISKPVREALGAAQKLLNEGTFDQALVSAQAALAAATTDEERFYVHDTMFPIQLKLKNQAGAADSAEMLVGSPLLPPDQLQTRQNHVCILRAQAEQWAQAIAACSTYADKYNDRAVMVNVAKLYFRQKDWPSVIKWGERAVAGVPNPELDTLRIIAQAYIEQKDNDGIQRSYEMIVDHHPSNRYWTDLLSVVEMKNRTDPRYVLDIARLRVATGVAEIPGELIDLAEAALKIGLPGEANAVLQRANDAGQTGTGAVRTAFQATLANARTEAAADLRSLAAAEAESKKSPKGEPDLRTGEALASHGRLDQGIAAMQRGIAKGGLKDATEARLRLGLAYLAAGKQTEALTELDAATAGAGLYAPVARLWGIHLRNQVAGTPATVSEEDAQAAAEAAADAAAEEAAAAANEAE
jgi:hypothetical protein